VGTTQIEETVREMMDAWNRRDLDTYVSLLHEDITWDDPAMLAPAVGKTAVREFSESVLRAFPDFTYEIRGPICVDETGTGCAVPWRIRGTHSAPLDPPGYGPTMRTAEFEGVDLIRVRGTRVDRIETLFNVLVPAEQLLAVSLRPRPGSVGAKVIVGLQRIVAWVVRRFRTSRRPGISQHGDSGSARRDQSAR
jgi:hypothetical protein